MPLRIIRQDITKMDCDAIVNPSNKDLQPGGGTDLAIHAAAGPALYEYCKTLGGCPVGAAKLTPAFDLPCKYVIHTAGPNWFLGNRAKSLLISCYKECLKLALENHCESVAFPLISSGTYDYPKDQVLNIAIRTINEFLFEHEMMVYLVVYDKKAYELSKKLFTDISTYIDDHYVLAHSDRSDESRVLRQCLPMQALSSDCRQSTKQSAYRAQRIPIDAYIKLDKSFAYKLFDLIQAKGISTVECYKKANVSKQTWHKIETDKNYKPNKKTAISFAMALELTLEETQMLLSSVGFVLSNSSLFDVIIMYCIENRIYDVLEIDAILFQYDQETLYSKA
ncbi:MAG: RNase III inhibitor [Ruminococcaceae bacterium]|nr:RNase III inhibitor [Oscillospiraceae bacterium]